MGFPACHFDDTHIKMMLAKGVSVEDARDYCMMGCVEPQKSGRLYQWTSTSYTQWPIAIELTLNHGVPLWYGKQVTPDLGDLDQYHTFEEFEAAVKSTIYYITKWTSVMTVISQRVHRDMAPKPLMSIMFEGCMESGKDVSAGGAMYNFGPGVVWSGLATYADSMAAIKKLVFDDHKYTLCELNEGLKADFEGYERMRQDCLDAPKYGNDDDYADHFVADIVYFTEHIHSQFKTLYSRLSHGTLSISNNTPFGQMTGASANGRKAWTPLSDGISPTQGAAHNGPTAIISRPPCWIPPRAKTAWARFCARLVCTAMVRCSSTTWTTRRCSTPRLTPRSIATSWFASPATVRSSSNCARTFRTRSSAARC